MATRTLGVKFEVVGFKEAANSVHLLKQGINDSLAANRENVRVAQKIDSRTSSIVQNAKTIVKQKYSFDGDYVGNTAQTYQLIASKQYRQAAINYARPRVNAINGGFFEGIGNAAGTRFFDRLDSIFRSLTGREEHRETVELGNKTISKIGLSISRSIKGKSPVISQRDKNLGKGSVSFKQNNLVERALSQALMPLRTIQYSFFEGIGSNFGNQFAEGLSQVLNDDLDISFNRKGQVTGKAISYTATEGVDKLKRDLGDVGSDFNDFRYGIEDGKVDEIGSKFNKLIKSIARTVTSVADSYLRGFRKGSVQLEAIRQIEKEVAKKDNSAPDLTGKKKVIYTVSGFAGEQGQRGKYMAQQLKPYVKDDTEVIGADNRFTDVLSPHDKNAAMWGVSALANLAKINLKGFNPDAVELAAKVINTLAANPDIEVDLLGHSAGGFVVEEAQEILSQLGYKDRIKSRVVGTPQMLGGLENPNVDRIMGDNDFRIKPIEQSLEYVGAATPTEKEVKGVKDHFFQDYLDSDEFLDEILGDSKDEEKVQELKKNKPSLDETSDELSSLNKELNDYLKLLREKVDSLRQNIQQNIQDGYDSVNVIGRVREARIKDKGQKRLQKELKNKPYKQIDVKEGTETVVAVVGGFAGTGGTSGTNFANKISGIVKDDSVQYVGLNNQFTDVIRQDEAYSGTSEGQQLSIARILNMFAKVQQIGYNPDAIEAAAKIIDLQASNPDLNIKVAGYSGGGFVAEDIIRLLTDYGADLSRISAMGIGTPELPGEVKTEGLKKVFGDEDNIYGINDIKGFAKKLKDVLGIDLFSGLAKEEQNIEGVDRHNLDHYIFSSKEVQDFLFSDPEKLEQLSEVYSYINEAQKMSESLANEIERVNSDVNFPPQLKLPYLENIRKKYAEILKTIVELADYGKELGGGKYFSRLGKEAKRNIKSLRVDEPTRRSTPQNTTDVPNSPQPQTSPRATRTEENQSAAPNPQAEPVPDPWDDPSIDSTATSNIKQLKNQYKQFLNNLITSSNRTAEATVNTVVRDFKTLNKGSQQNYLNTIRSAFNVKARLFREAVRNSQFDIAKDQGEQLLKMTALLKALYQELDEDAEIDGEVKSKLLGMRRYATSVQNEVIEGTGGTGRVEVGLTDLFEVELVNLEEDGRSVVAGFVESILAQLGDVDDAGEAIGGAVDEGTRRSLDMRSPSRKFQEIGRFVVEGFRQGLRGMDRLGDEMEQRGREVVEQTEQGIKSRLRRTVVNIARTVVDTGSNVGRGISDRIPDVGDAMDSTVDSASQEVRELREDMMEEFSGELQQLEDFVEERVEESREVTADSLAQLLDIGGENLISLLGSLIFDASSSEGFERTLDTIAQLAGKVVRVIATFKILKTVFATLGLNKLVDGFTNLREAGLEVAKVSETLNQRIIDISQSASAGAENLAFITKEAQRLNKDLNVAKENYAELLGATTDNPLSGVQTELIYTAFAATSRTKGFTVAEEQRLFKSIRSMIGKEIISQEEIRQEISELLPEFPRLLALSTGVSLPQLNKMIEGGQLKASDALPKVAAALNTQNGIGATVETTQTKEARLDSSISSFREAVGEMFLPLQKFGYDELTGFFNWLTDKVKYVQSIIAGTITTLLIYLATWKTLSQIVQKAVLGLIKVIVSFKVAIAKFLGVVLLVQVAIETWANVFKLLKNSFPEARKDISSLTNGINKYRQAIELAADSSKDLNNNLPQSSKDLQTGERAFGTDWLNLDTIARKPINWVLGKIKNDTIDGLMDNSMQANSTGVSLLYDLIPDRITTQAEKKQNDFIVNNSDYQMAANSIIMENYKALQVAEKIVEYDAQIAEIQSKRLSLLPGDTEGLKASLDAEKKIQNERDKQLKILTQQQQNLQLTIDAGKRRLAELESLRQSGGITEDNYSREKTSITGVIEDAEDKLNDLNDEISRLPKQLSEFSRRLRTSSERVAGFMEERDRISTQERTQIITEGVKSGSGEQTIQIEIERSSQKDIEKRIKFLQDEIGKVEQDLGSAALATGLQRVEEAAQNSGGLTTEVINRMLEQERDSQEKEALSGALKVREMQTQLYQYQEQFAQSVQQSRSSLLDYSRTIEDYFFNLTQRLKEARVEAKTLLSQIFATNIKNKLRSALRTGSDSFVNGIIDSITSILDQAQSLIERSLGIDSSIIGFETETRSLELEMRDFIRSVGGATDALLRFTTALDEDTSPEGTSFESAVRNGGGSSNSSGDIVTNLRRAIIGKESAGKFNAVNPHSGALGYGQVMPFNVANWTEEATGRAMSPKAFLSNPGAQIRTIEYKLKQYLDRELKATGNNLELAVRRVASTWYSGRPGLYNDTRPQTYGAGKYPSINDYTADILRRFRSESGGNVWSALSTRTALSNEVPSGDVSSANNTGYAQRASKLKNQVVNNLGQNINLQEILLQLDLDGQFKQAIATEQEKIRRQFKLEALTQENKGRDLDDKLQELQSRSSLTTAESEMLSQLRSTASEFRNVKVEGASELLRLGDTSANIKGVVEIFPSLIEQIRNSANEEFIATIPLLQETLSSARSLLPQINQELDKAQTTIGAIAKTEQSVVQFIERQGRLKIEAEDITKRTALQTVRTTIATQRGTNELKRQNETTAEKLRLEQRINEIRQANGDTDYSDNLIQLERQQSRVNRQNIDRSAVDRELEYEQKLLQLDEGIASSSGSILDRLGANFKANTLRRDAAIAQEDFRFEQEILQLQRKYEAEPELLELLIQKAEELNQVKLQQIKNQFGGVKEKIEELSKQSLTSFFENVFTAFSRNGDKQRQLLEQELAYNKELLGLEEKYRNNPGGLDFARERVKKLNEEKLDKIKSEFNIFNRVVDAARQAVIFLLKEIARMAAVKAASSILTSIIGGGVGAAAGGAVSSGTKMSLDTSSSSAISAFTAKDGITVSRPISDRLQQMSPAIKSAFKREGKQGVLGVFTPGEEILSIKTGEAGRYQALKKKLGIDPLKRIEDTSSGLRPLGSAVRFAGNFAEGGTIDIEGNLLSQLNTSNQPVNLKMAKMASPPQKQVINNVTNFSANIVTPDADSFRESTYQRQQDIAEALFRAR